MSPRSEKGQGKYNVVVIGAGTAGLVTAAGTAGLGGRVALVEAHKMGGDCLNFGCVPSKGLIASAKLIQHIRDGENLGLREMVPEFDFQDVFASMRKRRAIIEPNDSAERFEGLGVDVFLGRARFVSPHEVEVDGARLHARNFVIATGTKATVPDISGLSGIKYYTNETIFDELPAAPASLLVVGGGPIGCELSQVMNRLGVEVILVQQSPRLLPRDDAEAAEIVQRHLHEEGVRILAGSRVIKLENKSGKTAATIESPRGVETVLVEAVLLAAGRTPNTEGLNLEAAGVRYGEKGVDVDASLTTSQSHIFACGDIAGPHRFTHAADYQARIVVRNILIPWIKAKADYTWIPWVTYTEPELAHTGLNAEQARKRGIPHDVHRFEWSDNDRAVTDGDTTGFIKVVTAAGKDRILGATVVGSQAGNVLHELLIAGKYGIGLAQLSSTIHAYPTLSQGVQRVGDLYQKKRLTPTVAKIFTWLYRTRRRS
jgi:pyruvate/2-oxoglutarate dehydrogenase complex dihydrolipoamide dehydrogenase (E3) component